MGGGGGGKGRGVSNACDIVQSVFLVQETARHP